MDDKVKRKQYNKEYYLLTKDQKKEYRKEYNKEYYQQHKEKAQQYTTEYRKNYPEKADGYYIQSYYSRWVSSIKQRAKKYNLPFDLDPDYLRIITPTVCPVLGLVLESNYGKKL